MIEKNGSGVENAKAPTFFCTTCHRVIEIRSKNTVHNHVQAHKRKPAPSVKVPDGQPRPCRRCGQVLYSRAELAKHTRSAHAADRPYVCATCGCRCFTPGALTAHEKLHSAEKPFVCEKCGRRFALRRYYESHMMSHDLADSDPELACAYCPARFRSEKLLSQHCRQHVEEECQSASGEAPRIFQRGRKNYLWCADCRKYIWSRSKFHTCQRDASGVARRAFVCMVCRREFKSFLQVVTHLFTVHEISDPRRVSAAQRGSFEKTPSVKGLKSALVSDTSLCCKHCGRHISLKTSYHLCKRGGKGGGRSSVYVCCRCGSEFESYNVIMRHLIEHEIVVKRRGKISGHLQPADGAEANKLKDSFQGEGDSLRDSGVSIDELAGGLQSDSLDADGDESYDDVFISKTLNQLQSHQDLRVLVTSGDRPSGGVENEREQLQTPSPDCVGESDVCPINDGIMQNSVAGCQKPNGIINRNHGILHKLVDTSNSSASIRRHTSPASGKSKSRHSCAYCDKVFPRKANLIAHRRSRHRETLSEGDEIFRCPVCGVCLSYRQVLQRHMRRHGVNDWSASEVLEVSG